MAAATVGCSVSPVPEPPQAEPALHGTIELDARHEYPEVVLTGLPGATEHASHVWAVNLERPAPAVEVPTNPDGSFSLALAVLSGEEVRLQARRGARRSVPRDYEIDASRFADPLRPAPRPLADCFAAPVEWNLGSAELGRSVAASLQLQSSCPSDLEIAAVELRTAPAALRVDEPTGPLLLAGGDTLNVTLTFTPSEPGSIEDLLLIEIAGPSSDRRAIHVFADSDP